MERAMDEFFDGEVEPTQHQHRSEMQQQSSTQLVPQQLESRSPPTQQQQAVQQSSLGSGLEQAEAVVQQQLGVHHYSAYHAAQGQGNTEALEQTPVREVVGRSVAEDCGVDVAVDKGRQLRGAFTG